MSTPNGPRRLLLGSCPDSWGVWFADDPRQTPWHRFLDELAAVGYTYLELGPYGYLPTDPARLRDEVGRRGLTVAGGTVAGHSGLHKAGDFDSILAETRRVAELTAAVGARHVIFVPVPGYRDDVTGTYREPAELDAGGWRTLIGATNEIGRQIAQDYGVRLQFHPHADKAEAEDLAFGQAVAMGASCEPPHGLPDIPPILAALEELGAELFTVVEQDMYPCDVGKPKPIAERTFRYLNALGGAA